MSPFKLEPEQKYGVNINTITHFIKFEKIYGFVIEINFPLTKLMVRGSFLEHLHSTTKRRTTKVCTVMQKK